MMTHEAKRYILDTEGGYVNDPDDLGGETNLGITSAKFYDAKRRGIVKSADVRSLTTDEALRIYELDYWIGAGCEKMPPRVALVHFDGAVNHGVQTAGKILQQALNLLGAGLVVDGRIGQKTLDALRGQDEDDVVKALLAQRLLFYRAIVKAKPKQGKFLRGWQNRIVRLGRRVGVEVIP